MLKNKDYIPNIIEFFGLDLRLYGNKMIGCCPVHKGDNKTAFNLWPRSGFWVCRSHNCHEVFDKTFDGLLKGLYAANYKNWDGGASIDISDKEIDTFYNQIIKGNAPTPISIQPTIIKKTKQFKPLTIDYFLRNLIYPCPFFSKKFSEKIIRDFKIGYCNNPRYPMFGRSVVPIIEMNKVIGYQGRSVFEQCKKCSGYHHPNSMCGEFFEGKWKFNPGFHSNNHLFNYTNVAVVQPKTIFLTESVGNVFRLIEFGIPNALATFGARFSPYQEDKVRILQPERIVYIKDKGPAGDKISDLIKKITWAEVIIPELEYEDDVAAVTKEYFQDKLLKDLMELNI
jgi:hypothetical protein